MPKTVNASAYGPVLGSVKDKHAVDAAVTYDFLHSSEGMILKINQEIRISSMENNLIYVIQWRLNNVKIFDYPEFLIENPTSLHHIIVQTPTDCGETLVIPLSLKGITSYLPTRKSNLQEYKLADK